MSFDPIGTPWQHQLAALNQAGDLSEFALFMGVGTGKTYTSILIARYWMYKAGHVYKTLVLAPPVVLDNWKKEWLAHSKIDERKIGVLYGPGKKRAEQLLANDYLTIITNYESLLMEPVLKALKKWGPAILIADESHRCKSYSAQRTKKTIELSRLTKHRLILTGTPVLASPMDLFSQFMVLDHGKTFGTNFRIFRGTYFIDRNARMPSHIHFPKWELRHGALQEISKKIQNCSISVKKEDCLDLPPLVRTLVKVELSSEQRRLYMQMSEDLITYLDGKACVARLALTKVLRLLQIISGHIVTEGVDGEDREISHIKDNPRATALHQLVEDISESGKIIIWCAFRHDYEVARQVCAKLNLGYVEIHGEISAQDKFKAVERFQCDEGVRVCIGHPNSGGIGISLTAAPFSIYYSRTYSLEADLQSEARNHRAGSEIHQKITRYDLVAAGTIDEFVLEKLGNKQLTADTILKDLRYVLERESGAGSRKTKDPGRDRSAVERCG